MRDKLIELLNSFLGGCEIRDITPPYGVENLADYLIANGVTVALEAAPAVDAYTEQDIREAFNEGYTCGMEQAELVKHGEWLERAIPLNWCEDDVDIIYVCSECEGLNYCESPYCPNCGAKMERIKDNDTC